MPEIQIEFDVPAEIRDGTVLRADVYRPGGTGPWPVPLSRLPHGKQTPMIRMEIDRFTTRGPDQFSSQRRAGPEPPH
ncbi:hypothetical protein [Streptomyces sp. NBC_00286]|uniref:hypothetical protein n=1 Tax=Streptomyces sp. NBC_00286 TaxID=2975701 RepID=UPI002E2C5A65|nr:hypothetical protein [Streptomyces sp. NBC_00286]